MVSGSVAVVTGGAGDLGRGVCRALASSGATVVSLDDRDERTEDATRVHCDVTDAAACAAAIDDVVAQHGGVDTLVNLAQRWTHVSLMDTTDEDVQMCFESGPFATLRMMQLCYPHMKARGGGSIVNFASASGTQGGVQGEGAYAGAKEAIRGITKHAAVEWGPDNIRANVICPLATHDPNRWGDQVAGLVPLQRLGDPEAEIGGTVVFLSGPAGAFITGRTLHVDGGVGTWR